MILLDRAVNYVAFALIVALASMLIQGCSKTGVNPGETMTPTTVELRQQEAELPQPVNCLPFTVMSQNLMAKHQEFPRFIAKLDHTPAAVTFFMSNGGATWTMIAVNMEKIACVMASGTALEIFEPPQGL